MGLRSFLEEAEAVLAKGWDCEASWRRLKRFWRRDGTVKLPGGG
jgi:hypothetical protein